MQINRKMQDIKAWWWVILRACSTSKQDSWEIKDFTHVGSLAEGTHKERARGNPENIGSMGGSQLIFVTEFRAQNGDGICTLTPTPPKHISNLWNEFYNKVRGGGHCPASDRNEYITKWRKFLYIASLISILLLFPLYFSPSLLFSHFSHLSLSSSPSFHLPPGRQKKRERNKRALLSHNASTF